MSFNMTGNSCSARVEKGPSPFNGLRELDEIMDLCS